jgi:hypothetical protein
VVVTWAVAKLAG